MRSKKMLVLAIIVLFVVTPWACKASFAGEIVAWGRHSWGQCNVPAGSDFTAIAAGYGHSLALKANGTLMAWGGNSDGQCDVPAGSNFTAIAAGYNYSLALKDDGSLLAWGNNRWGQCNVATGNEFVAISGGTYHCLALKNNGSVVAWGWNGHGQCEVPTGNDFVAIAAGGIQSLAMKDDGSLVGWGEAISHGIGDVPTGNNFVAIAAGNNHSLALTADGSLVAWGYNGDGRCDVPAGNDFVAIAGGNSHSLAVKADGSLAAWGWNSYGQCDVPSGNDFVAIAPCTCSSHNLALVRELGVLVRLEITGSSEVAENFSASYKAIAHYKDDSTRDVTDSALWVVEPNTYASIDDYGVLTTEDIVKHESATIRASYTEGDVTVNTEKPISIFAICPTGTALQFDGVDDYVDCGNDSSLDITDNITISLWFYSESWAPRHGYNGLISKRENFYLGLDWEIYYDRNHREIRLYDGSVVTFDNLNVNPSLNTWHHLVITKNGTIATFYLDGILKGTDTTSLSWDRGASVRIGVIGLDRLDCGFNGLIDEVRIYNRALSAEEIQANMHTRLAGDEAGLLGYWDFDESAGQIVYDLSGNGNDGQLGSTPNPDVSDPAWVESDAPVGICSLYQIATMAAERAVERKTALLEELLAALAEEWTAYEALEELLESGDYGDLNKGDIVTAKQKIHSATQHQEQSIGALEKNVEKLKDALSALGYEPDTAANIDENGVLRTKDIVKHQSATILASYTEGDVTVNAEKPISIFAICPTGTALQFDGVNDYVDFSRNIITTTEFTVSAWANHYGSPGGSSPVNAIFQQRDDASQAGYAQSTILLATEYPGDYAVAIIRSSGGSSIQRLTYPKKNYGGWHQYSMTVDSDDFVFYVDGVEVDRTSNNQTGDYVTSIDYVSIGRHSYRRANRGLFNGVIDEVAIYNRALSAEEIQANMHTRLAGDEPGLVGYWDFDEGGGQIVYDLSGNDNNGQLGSTPNPDVSDPAWVKSDAPVGICSLYQIATMAAERALGRKTALLEELLAALAEEWTACEALEELLESGDYGDLNKGDIVTAKQKIHSATQHGEQAIDALEKSIEKLEDALSALGYEPEPPPPPPGQASNPNPADGARWVSPYANLSWTAGSNAVSHDVYFGTTSPGTFRGNQTATTFDPGTMAYGATYYWRIDEVNPSGTTTGTVWSFITTGGGPR